MKNIEDQKIIAEYMAGNEEAFELLLKKHLNSLYNFIIRYAWNQADAEDITQEVFIKVWKNLKKYNPEKNFRPWIFQIAKNTALDFLRKRKSRPQATYNDFLEAGGNLENQYTDPSPLPAEKIIVLEKSNELHKFIKSLPDIYRITLELHFWEEFSLKEIADILNEPLDTVKSRYRRALILLRKMIVKE